MTLIQDALTSSKKDPVNLPSLSFPVHGILTFATFNVVLVEVELIGRNLEAEISKASRIEGTTLTQAKAIGSKLKVRKG
jgi:hypothetical protein